MNGPAAVLSSADCIDSIELANGAMSVERRAGGECSFDGDSTICRDQPGDGRRQENEMSLWSQHDLTDQVVRILSDVHCNNEVHHFGRPFISAYQHVHR